MYGSMGHIASALDNCQGDSATESQFGAILPCLFAVQRKLDCRNPKYCGSHVDALKNGLQKRFGDFMSIDHCGENRMKSKTAIIAAVTHPFFQLRWLQANPDMKKVAEGLFLRELHKRANTR